MRDHESCYISNKLLKIHNCFNRLDAYTKNKVIGFFSLNYCIGVGFWLGRWLIVNFKDKWIRQASKRIFMGLEISQIFCMKFQEELALNTRFQYQIWTLTSNLDTDFKDLRTSLTNFFRLEKLSVQPITLLWSVILIKNFPEQLFEITSGLFDTKKDAQGEALKLLKLFRVR